MEKSLISLLEHILLIENIDIANKLHENDKIFYSEFYEMLETLTLNPFDLYKDLTYFYVRYSGAIIPYKHIPSFLDEKPENVILFLISYFRTICAYNILNIYEEIITQSQTIISNSLKGQANTSNKIVSLIKSTNFEINPEEKFINIEASLCTFAEYFSFLKKFIETSKLLEEDLEFLLAVSFYFGYYNPEDSTK